MICWIATARRTFVCFSSASRSPRSANTFPELRATDPLFRPFAISCLVVLAGDSEPPRNQVHIALSRLSALRRLLLERMQHVNRMLELYHVHGPVSIAPVVGDDFQNARAFALPRLRFRMLAAKLRHAESGSDVVFHCLRKLPALVLRRADPKQRFFTGNALRSHHGHYPSSGMSCPELLLRAEAIGYSPLGAGWDHRERFL